MGTWYTTSFGLRCQEKDTFGSLISISPREQRVIDTAVIFAIKFTSLPPGLYLYEFQEKQ